MGARTTFSSNKKNARETNPSSFLKGVGRTNEHYLVIPHLASLPIPPIVFQPEHLLLSLIKMPAERSTTSSTRKASLISVRSCILIVTWICGLLSAS